MKEIQLQFTTEEVNTLLEGLGNLPFVRVFQLIGKIQEQAARQINQAPGENGHATQPETRNLKPAT